MSLNIQQIGALLEAAVKITSIVTSIAEQVKDGLQEDDRAKLQDQIDNLQKANDEAYNSLMAKLKE